MKISPLKSLLAASFFAVSVASSSAWCEEKYSSSGDSAQTAILIAQDSDTSTSSEESSSSSSSDDSSSSSASTTTGSDGETTKSEKLKDFEVGMNAIAYSCMFSGLVTAFSLFVTGVIVLIKRQIRKWWGGILIAWSVFASIGAVAIPGISNWLTASAVDAKLIE